jgi:hypothetical protein
MYTACDVTYQIDVDPYINNNLKLNFERKLLIYVDHLTDQGRYHLKFLRFPHIDYSAKNPLEEMRSIKEFDTYFYLARSKEPYYYMLTNTEARGLYLDKINELNELAKYKCFDPKVSAQNRLQRLNDQTLCEQADGLWEKKCEQDTDCPYYKANRNYPNTFGGCNKATGYCLWPADVEALTYRKPKNPDQGFCYNCHDGILGKGTVGHCCPKQKDRRDYPSLESPDYVFLEDTATRFKHRDLFDKYNLNWSWAV